MGEASSAVPAPEAPTEKRLDSWKAIAAHLKRDVTTVQRWEKREGLPVHRHVHDKRGSVYAPRSEIDGWLESRRQQLIGNAQEAAESAIGGAGERPDRRAVWRRRLFLAGSAALVLAALIYMAMRGRGGTEGAKPRIRSVAVLPLKNMSGDPSQEFLADGITEALIGQLSRIHDLRVVSRTSIMRFKETKQSVPQIAKILQVDGIVEGSVIREGNRIRVYAQLIRSATDEHVWSEDYDRELKDILTLESDVAQSIALRVEASVTGEEQKRLSAARQVAPEVYESYLKGEFALYRSKTKSEIEESGGYFQEAINKDPSFAPAYLGLASVYSDLGTVFVGERPEASRPKELNALKEALALDPNLAEAHSLLAKLLQQQWQWAEAEEEYKQALKLKPNAAEAHVGFSGWLLCQGRTGEAVTWARRGRELDPLAVSGSEIGWTLFQSRRYEESVRELRSALAVKPDDPEALWFLGFSLIAQNQPKQAIPVLEKVLALTDRRSAVLGVLIHAYAQAGRRRDALALLAELHRRRKQGYVPAGAFVNAYIGLGENEQAFYWLNEACKEQSNILQLLKVHPYFDALRQDPRFAALLHRVGLDRQY